MIYFKDGSPIHKAKKAPKRNDTVWDVPTSKALLKHVESWFGKYDSTLWTFGPNGQRSNSPHPMAVSAQEARRIYEEIYKDMIDAREFTAKTAGSSGACAAQINIMLTTTPNPRSDMTRSRWQQLARRVGFMTQPQIDTLERASVRTTPKSKVVARSGEVIGNMQDYPKPEIPEPEAVTPPEPVAPEQTSEFNLRDMLSEKRIEKAVENPTPDNGACYDLSDVDQVVTLLECILRAPARSKLLATALEEAEQAIKWYRQNVK